MSGGSMDYLYSKLEDARIDPVTPLRRAFIRHIKKVAQALYEIEWADSGDTTKNNGNERLAIMDCIGSGAELEQIIDEARNTMSELQRALKEFEK